MMEKKPSDIFCEYNDLDSFREYLCELKGNFYLDRDEMVRLGEEYFKKYPDTLANRDYGNIHTGYRLMRLCLLEKALEGFSDESRDAFRESFENMKQIKHIIPAYVQKRGKKKAWSDYHTLYERMQEMNRLIETIPQGMIRERFVGGITNFINILYLIRLALEREDES